MQFEKKNLNNPENDKKYIYRNFEMLVHTG